MGLPLPDKEFLETYPLYRPLHQTVADKIPNISWPSISQFCALCKSNQTYLSNSYHDGLAFAMNGGDERYTSANKVLQIKYVCAGCEKTMVTFCIKVSPDLKSIMKVGQDPAWDIAGDKSVEKLLGKHKSYLRKGMICESQGYGIAAFAYYRRITEEVIDKLIRDIEEIMPEEDRETFAEAYEKVKKTRQTSEKIALVKDLLPPSLVIEGMNPLGILHSALSEGLHAEEDEACLSYAETIRVALIFMSSQISETRKKKQDFTQKMRGLLAKKS